MERREQILTTATELFREKGLHFTMQEVAQSMGASKKTLYTVYPSKEELLLDMVDTLFERIHRKKDELIHSDAPVEQRIKSVIVALPEDYDTVDFRLMGELEETYPAVARRVKQHLETGWEPTLTLLEEGIAQGRIRPVPICVLRQIITASIEGFLYADHREFRYAQMLEDMMDILMNGIRRREDEV